MPDAQLYPVSRVHLEVLTDAVGVMQHAIGSRPDPGHGYCTDDVARALQVDLLHQRELGWEGVAPSAWRSLRFLEDAFDETAGRFRNFRHVDGTWIEGAPSEDSQGRAMLALGETVDGARDTQMVEQASRLFLRALPAAQGLHAIRAQSSVLLGCDAALRTMRSGPLQPAYRALARRLRAAFDQQAAADWPWPETRLTYENALPVHALIRAGLHLDSPGMTQAGLDALDWLIVAQTAPTGHFSPVGNTWWSSGGIKPQFDQQPIEATAIMLASESAYRLTGNVKYRIAMERAYAWFLGGNDLGLDLADPDRGTSYDGLTPTGVNLNQGAESTLMWLMALEHIRALRRDPATAPGDRDQRAMSLTA